MAERTWRSWSGWCLTLGRPDCDRCRVADCGCPGCVAKRSEPARNKGNERGMVAAVRENGATSETARRPAVDAADREPGPNSTLVRSAKL